MLHQYIIHSSKTWTGQHHGKVYKSCKVNFWKWNDLHCFRLTKKNWKNKKSKA